MGFKCFYRSIFRSYGPKRLYIRQILYFLSYKEATWNYIWKICWQESYGRYIFITHLQATATSQFFFKIPVNIRNECIRYLLFCN